MSINYGDSGILIKYIQYFLHDNYSKVFKMSGTYDKYTHSKLVEYLDMPNITSPTELVGLLKSIEYSSSGTHSYLRYPLASMQCHIDINTIVFHIKNPKYIKGFDETQISDINAYNRFLSIIPAIKSIYDDVYNICKENGWRIAEYIDMVNSTHLINEDIINDKRSLSIVIKTNTPSNIFPHHDMRYMINYFQDNYVNNVEISAGYFNKSSIYRVALIEVNPGDQFILAHSYSYSVPVVLGFCTDSINSVKDILYTSTNNTSLNIRKVNNNKYDKVLPGMPILINVPDDYEYRSMVIQLPMIKYTKQTDINKQAPLSFTDVNLKVGDINDDGVIDDIDLLLYAPIRPRESISSTTISSTISPKFYLNTEYKRYYELCKAVKERYNTLFINNGNYEEYNTSEMQEYLDEEGRPVYNIDTLVSHLQELCIGTNVKFYRHLFNNEINYEIVTTNQANININILDTYANLGIAFDDFADYIDNPDNAGINLKTLINSYIVSSIESDKIIYSHSTLKLGAQLIGNDNMTGNSLLAIKTNPDDEINNCDQIILGHKINSKGTLNIPVSEFKDNPWIVRDELITALLNMLISKYSNTEDIAYIHDLISADPDNPYKNSIGRRSEYGEQLRRYIQSIQITVGMPFSLGYYNPSIYNVLYDSFIMNRLFKKSIEEDDY